jgi:hypothetical protein
MAIIIGLTALAVIAFLGIALSIASGAWTKWERMAERARSGAQLSASRHAQRAAGIN